MTANKILSTQLELFLRLVSISISMLRTGQRKPKVFLALTNVGAGAQEGSMGPGSCCERIGCSMDGSWGREVGDSDEDEWEQGGHWAIGSERAGQTHQSQ